MLDFIILDKELKSVDVIESYQSIIWNDRYSKFGDFEIYTSANEYNLKKFKIGYYIWSSHTDRLMIIENLKIDTDIESGANLQVTGRSLESILDRRIIWFQTTLDGYIDGQIKKLLIENIISPSDNKRKIDNFVYKDCEDENVKKIKIQSQFTGDNLYDTIKDLCETNGLGFKITVNDKQKFVFELYKGVDRSYAQNERPYVIFSPNFDNLINSQYSYLTEQLKNITLIAGEGEDNDRVTTTYGDQNISGIDRREMYTDARDLSSTDGDVTMPEEKYISMLMERGKEKLNDQNDQLETFAGEVETTVLYKYNEDYFMGDITELENEFGMSSRTRIVEYIVSKDNNGFLAYPTFETIREEV